ncbi:MAG: YdbH domain-containing protein [Alphaproteobacteria bacterium]|nr:YdbH domain-containing protein [Alphaproteobacteria bacterium]
MKKSIIALILVIINLVFLLGALFFLLPWKNMIGDRIAQELQRQGFPDASLSLTALSMNALRIEDLKFGEKDDPLIISEIAATYDFQEVQEGKLQTLTVKGVNIALKNEGEGWSLRGWPKTADGKAPALIPPVRPEYKNTVPADSLSLQNGALSVNAQNWTLSLPLAGLWQKSGQPEFSLKPARLDFEGGGVTVSGLLETSASLNEEKKKWEGTWSLKSMTAHQQGAQEDIPPADLSGTLSADEKTLIVTGKIKGENKSYNGAFKYAYPFAEPQKATLVLSDFSMPWQDGVLTTRNVNIPLSGNKPYTLDLKIAKASIAKLMQDFTGEYVKATGTISGSFPVRIGQDGKITVGKGTLSADEPGQLSMPPESIPGEGAQMQLTRDILEQFNYKLLSLTTEQEGKDGLAIILRIEGNNPKVENGRPVILNIRLTGDLLDFITSSAIVFTSPQTLLKQGTK